MTAHAMNEQIEMRLLAAFEMQQKGRYEDAERGYSSILNDDPDNVHAHNLLGVICLNSGRPVEAEAHILSALRIHSDDPEAYANLALAYKAMGRLEDAKAAIISALTIEPARPASLALLGSICLDLGSSREAITYLLEALKNSPPKPEWLVSLSVANCQLGQMIPAIAAARSALQIDREVAEAHLALGEALLKACEYGEARLAFEYAASIKPALADAWVGLGTAHKEAGDDAEAYRVLSEACDRFPREPRCHFMLGTLHEQQGKVLEAASKFRDAIRANPEYGAAYFQLLQLPGSSLDEAEIRDLNSLVDEDTAPKKSAHAHFAAALLHEGAGRYQEAIEQYLRGHRILGRHHKYDDTKTSLFFKEVEPFLDDPGPHRNGSDTSRFMPVFVVGMPRSGTTLLEQILAAHPMVDGAGESSFLEDCVRQAERLTRKAYPACLELLTPMQAKQLRETYLGRLGRINAAVTHIVDKTPLNFQYVAFVRRILPHARVVHCKRDPLETCISIFRLPFDPSQAYAHELQDLGAFYVQYRSLMESTEQLQPQAVLPVHLDDLIDNPDRVVRSLCEFLGLAYDPAMLNFHQTKRIVRTPSALQVREPLRRAPMRWGDRFGEAIAPLRKALIGNGQKL